MLRDAGSINPDIMQCVTQKLRVTVMIKVQDIVYVSYSVPDLDIMTAFLTDFGMSVARRTETTLYMRGAGDNPYICICEKGDPAFISVGFMVGSEQDLDIAARLPGSSQVEPLHGPGGGQRVRIIAPDGYRIDLVHGMLPAEKLPLRDPLAVNFAYEKERIGDTQRPLHEAARIVRAGHCVLKFNDATAAVKWFSDTLGLLVSDRLYIPNEPQTTLGVFMRCDRGELPSDHHNLFVIQAPGDINVHHVSFEVQDPDAVHIGHYWLKEKGWKPSWGVGRHLLGSQIFDYWRTPWGHLFEHYADGDQLPSDWLPGEYPASEENLAQWGPAIDPNFFVSVDV